DPHSRGCSRSHHRAVGLAQPARSESTSCPRQAMTFTTRLVRLLVVAMLAVLSTAQEGPVIRATTRLVQVSVIVRDKNGPVEGLKKEDFQIFDHGKEQKIAVFTVASTKAAAAAIAKLPPGIYTNRPERGGEPIGSVTVVLIDLLNTRFQDQAFAR